MPQFINIFELARRGETIEGEVAVKDLPNLLGFTATENGTLRFVATGLGERRGLPAVDLDMEGDVDISCARCLKPMSVHIASGAVFRLVRTEAEANALPIEDDEEDEDVLVGSRSFDLEKWVEEEAILALPRMVVHDACEEKREWSDGEEPQEEKRPNPFAALAALKIEPSASSDNNRPVSIEMRRADSLWFRTDQETIFSAPLKTSSKPSTSCTSTLR